MPLPKSKNTVGLGNTLMNDRFGKGKGNDMRRATAQAGDISRTNAQGQTYVTTIQKDPTSTKMQSVTEQSALDEFLSTAALAGTDFKAEKINSIQIIQRNQRNPFLLSATEERAAVKKQNAKRGRLTVPRRPPWNENTTARELEERERQSLLEWRRGLAELQEHDDLLMTPFERNLEVWRQLWRVIERSDLVVQIVDARNPLLFRSADLEQYVKESDARKNNLLLINKADMMTLRQRRIWAGYLKKNKINYKFFSAQFAREVNEARDAMEEEELEREASGNLEQQMDRLHLDNVKQAQESEEDEELPSEEEEDDGSEDEEDEEDEEDAEVTEHHVKEVDAGSDQETDAGVKLEPEPEEDLNEDDTQILTTDELEHLFLSHAPSLPESEDSGTRKVTVGLVGYPNVGKSSTINALMGAKKVSVSATPGKTKHFQTLHLSEEVILCDCPGLVFPNFATTKAELVCNGVLPIDQLREFKGPAGLVAQRIPRAYIEAVYGIKVPVEEGEKGVPTADELLGAYAVARGFFSTGKGTMDLPRAARVLLKDYVNGKLLFCQPPPADPPVDERKFNADHYKHVARKGKRDVQAEDDGLEGGFTHGMGRKRDRLDNRFFNEKTKGNAAHLSSPFEYSASTSSGKQLSGRKQKLMYALDNNIDPSDVKKLSSKKHFKGNRRKPKKETTAYE